MRSPISDTSWIRQSFMLPTGGINEYDAIRRIHTTADFKYTDTTIGGNFALNALPQFTRFADIKRLNEYKGSKGQGRFYSEAIDDHAQLIHIRLGLPKFNSLTRFFGDFYSVEASTLARTGRTPSVFFELGRAAGGVVTAGLQIFLLGAKFIRFFIDKPASRYYYLKPAMPLYWNAVSSIVNGIAVNMGVIPRIGGVEHTKFNEGVEWSTADIQLIRKQLPDIVREDGGIDIYAVSNRAQRLANAFNDALEKELAKSTSRNNMQSRLRRMYTVAKWEAIKTSVDKEARASSQKTYLDNYLSTPDGEFDRSVSPGATENDNREQSWIEKMAEFYHAERKMGADFVSFRVDHTGSATESFSNSTKPAGIADTINSTSASARDARFNIADGNIDDGVLGSAFGGAMNAIKDFIMGGAQTLSIHGIAALAGSAFVDIPDTWDSSTADVGRSTFTIPLRAPYAHNYSRLQNLVIPMAALLATCLPLSAGKQAYTAPFILELFNQGRTQVRLGMVESMTFTRGVGETGWLPDGRFMGVDVTLTIIDLSKVVHMPLNPGFGIGRAATMAVAEKVLGAATSIGGDSATGERIGQAAAAALMSSTYDDDNKYSDYLAVLGSLPMDAQINTFRKLKLRLTQQAAEFKAWTSPAHGMNWFMGTLPGSVIKAFSLATARE